MKRRTKILTGLALPVAAILLIAGCICRPSIRHLSAEEFLVQAKQVERANTMYWDHYVGSTHSRAYLEHGGLPTFGGCDRTTVYWTEIDGLPPELAERLRAGERPWKTYTERASEGEEDQATPTDQ